MTWHFISEANTIAEGRLAEGPSTTTRRGTGTSASAARVLASGRASAERSGAPSEAPWHLRSRPPASDPTGRSISCIVIPGYLIYRGHHGSPGALNSFQRSPAEASENSQTPRAGPEALRNLPKSRNPIEESCRFRVAYGSFYLFIYLFIY